MEAPPTFMEAPTKTRIAVSPPPTATDRSLDLQHHRSRIRTPTSIAATTKTRIAHCSNQLKPQSPPPTGTLERWAMRILVGTAMEVGVQMRERWRWRSGLQSVAVGGGETAMRVLVGASMEVGD
ncbi:uncharacterized protein G2W53_033370 [Senna tora]|uniref:Uncharacterized protein n=1 Tax=Senna tora TaxID=362788 RepID=A0A834SYC5_9FABA|nr:uncharacterized protein G2W53_033370 [Senna tora]